MANGYGINPWVRLAVAAAVAIALAVGVVIGVNLTRVDRSDRSANQTASPAGQTYRPGLGFAGGPLGGDLAAVASTPTPVGDDGQPTEWPTWTSPPPPSPSPSADRLIPATPFLAGEVDGVYHFDGQMWPPAVDVSPGPVEVDWLRPPVTDRLSAAQAGVCDTMIRLFQIDPGITDSVAGMVLRAGWGLGQDFAAELVTKLPTKVQVDNWFNDGASVRVSECLAQGWLFDSLLAPYDSRWRGDVTVFVDVNSGDQFSWTEQIIIPDVVAAQAEPNGETVGQKGDWRIIGAPKW